MIHIRTYIQIYDYKYYTIIYVFILILAAPGPPMLWIAA